MAKHFVQVDADGNVEGRVYCSSDETAAAYKKTLVSLSPEAYHSAPELWGKIDMIAKKVIAREGKDVPQNLSAEHLKAEKK
jgi:hypothetical protein